MCEGDGQGFVWADWTQLQLTSAMIIFRVTGKCLLWVFIITGQTLMYGLYSILVSFSKVDGEVPFLTSSLVLVIEVFKLLICLTLLAPSCNLGALPTVSLQDALRFSVPALCYTLNNNLSVFMQTQMDPATYMVLGNFKMLTTGLLYQLIMKKRLSYLQWMSLGLLTIGGALSSATALNTQVLSLSEIHCTWIGLCCMAVYCIISGFAGVYTEYQFKSSVKLSLLHQNVLLYLFGIVFNFCLWLWQNFQQRRESKTSRPFHIFNGFSMVVWMLVFSQSVVGLIMSVIVKYKSNITRLFVISSAPLVTTFLSYFFFHLHLQPMFLLAVFFVVVATFLYNFGKKDSVYKSKKVDV